MALLNRRDLMSLGGALLLARSVARAQTAPSTLTPPSLPPRMPAAWTSAETVALWPEEPPGGGFAPQPLPPDWPPVFVRNVAKPDLRVFRPARASGQALLVLPGGAYWFVSVANEGVALAERMNALGVTVFVLTYRLPGEGWKSRSEVPLQDAQRAMRVIRARAKQFAIDPGSLGVLGFSAGGHLAATLAVQHAEQTYAPIDAIDRTSARPFAAGLIYPVVTMMSPWTHDLSRKSLLGEPATDADIRRRSAELHVGGDTPPVFLAHAIDDDAVPVENSLRMMEALRAAGRPVEAHLLQEGAHAFGIGYPDTPSERWVEMFNAWLKRLPR